MGRVMLLICAGAFGCVSTTPAPDPSAGATMQVDPARPVCGWEKLGDRASEAPTLAITPEGSSGELAGGANVVIVEAHDNTPFAAVVRALEPIKTSLVRIKVPIEGRWLLPMTYPYRRPVERPPPEKTVVRMVGKRRITRWSDAPAERLAALELDRGDVVFDVENEGRARRAPLSALAELLAKSTPPVGVIALHVSDDTPWRQVVQVLQLAACHDRAPGQEPHEVILD